MRLASPRMHRDVSGIDPDFAFVLIDEIRAAANAHRACMVRAIGHTVCSLRASTRAQVDELLDVDARVEQRAIHALDEAVVRGERTLVARRSSGAAVSKERERYKGGEQGFRQGVWGAPRSLAST